MMIKRICESKENFREQHDYNNEEAETTHGLTQNNKHVVDQRIRCRCSLTSLFEQNRDNERNPIFSKIRHIERSSSDSLCSGQMILL